MLVTGECSASLNTVATQTDSQAGPRMRKDLFSDPQNRSLSTEVSSGMSALTADPGTETTLIRQEAGMIQRLEKHVIAGRLVEALDMCRKLRSATWTQGTGSNDALWAALIVPLIRRLEAAWTVDSVEFVDLTTAFMTLRRVISALSADMQPVFGHGNGRVLVATVPGETHHFGPQIVADLLRGGGWEADLMLDADAESLLQRVDQTSYIAIALSVGHDEALGGVADLIGDLRASARLGRVAIMIGGPALVEPRAQYHFLGADLVALSGAEAVSFLARHRVGQPVA